MKSNEILEGNKRIAEFMNLEEKDGFMTSCSGIEVSTKGYEHDNIFYPLNELRYDISWDWLMPVVEKIESKNYAVTITQNICIIQASIMGDRTIVTRQSGNYDTPNTKIYNTWIAVIEFINWHNEDK